MFGKKSVCFSKSPSIPALFLHLVALRARVSTGLCSIVPLQVYHREKAAISDWMGGGKGKSGGKRGRGQVWGPERLSGQVRPGQLRGQGAGSTRLQRLDPRISSYKWFAGAA